MLLGRAYGCVLGLFAVVSIAGSADLGDATDVRGFRVDFSAISDVERRLMLPSLEQQIAIVAGTRVPGDVLAFFRTVPIVIDPTLDGTNGEYRQRKGQWMIALKAIELPVERPILLHELLHAYQQQVLGIPTPEVGRAYRHAVESAIYPAGYRAEHFMKSGREYFAVIGQIFLHGPTHRPPYDCSIPKREQPEFIAFLAKHFGARECR